MTRPAATRDASAGLFVSIEGIDGAGKSTIADALADTATISGREIHVVRKNSPCGDGYIAAHAQGLKNILWGEQSEQQRRAISDMHWLWLASSWFALVEQVEIEPRLRAGCVVVTDSWFYKILARFLLKAPDVVEQATMILRALRIPGCTILLDLCPEVAAGRKRQFGYSECGNFDGFQGRSRENFVQYQTMVRRSYLRLAADYGWMTVGEPTSVDDVVRCIEQRIANP